MMTVLKKLENKIKHGQSAGGINRKIISEEGAFLWWLKRDLKEKMKMKQKQNKNMHYMPNIVQKKY
jgi:hypothetical protein